LRWLTSRNWLEIMFVRAPLAFLLMSVIGYVLLSFKVNISSFAPYSWDHSFAEIDRLLFFGQDPWVITHRIFSSLNATIFLDNLYLLWFMLMKLSMISVAVLPMRNHTRLTFLLAYGLNWIIGGVLLAIMLPAAGPVYMERITGDAMFAPLMDLLQQYSIRSRSVRSASRSSSGRAIPTLMSIRSAYPPSRRFMSGWPRLAPASASRPAG